MTAPPSSAPAHAAFGAILIVIALVSGCASPVRIQQRFGASTLATALHQAPRPATVRHALSLERQDPQAALAALLDAGRDAVDDLDTGDGHRTYDAVVGEVLSLLDQRFPDWLTAPPPGLEIDTSGLRCDAVAEGFSFEPATEFRPDGFAANFVRDGVGMAMVASAPSARAATLADHYPAEGRFLAVSAWLDFADDGATDAQARRAVLRLVDSKRVESVHIGGRDRVLAADFSLPHAFHLDRSEMQRKRIVGLFSAERFAECQGIFLMEPYDPEKIPLIMVHGFAASPLTWYELANAVNGSADLRNRYQIWQYAYATGMPFTDAALEFRRAVDAVHATIAEAGLPAPTSKPVYVAHSMGGLLVKSLLCDSGDRLRAAAGDAEADDEALTFSPSPHAGPAIFVATPFRGSGVAGAPYARIAGAIDAIASLSDDNAILREFAEIPISPGIPFHVILGRRFPLPGDNATDGLVSLASGRQAGAASELVVPVGTHNVHQEPEAIAAILEILRSRIREAQPHPQPLRSLAAAPSPDDSRPNRLEDNSGFRGLSAGASSLN